MGLPEDGTSDLALVDAQPWVVLIADDSPTWRGLIRSAVTEFDPSVRIIEAADGRQALDALAEQPVDVAFVDLAMPEMNGDDVVKHVQREGRMPFFAVVSATGDPEQIATMRGLAAYDYLVKPFDKTAIVRVLRTYERVMTRTRALVVDDSATARAIIRRILERSVFNFAVEEAGDGVSAFEAYVRFPAEIVFLDLNMPGIDGVQTLRILRAHNPAVRVIAMSTSQEWLGRLEGPGPAAFLKKPFSPHDLDRVVHYLFELRPPYSG
jgi:CheY-like chemotaxis protein